MINMVKLLWRAAGDQEEWKQKVLVVLLSVLDKYSKVATPTAVSVVSECCMVLPKYTDSTQHLDRIVKYSEQLLKSKWSNYKHTGLKILAGLIRSNKALLTSCQGLIVSCLNSGDTVLAQRAMDLIVKLTTKTNIESVYELFMQTTKSSRDVSAMQKQAIEILMCCDLTDLKLDWFACKLVQLFELGPVPHLTLNTILTYLSKAQNDSAAMHAYEQLYKSISSSDSTSLDFVIILLWIKVTHSQKFESADEKLSSLLTKICKNAHSVDNVTSFLTLVRSCVTLNVLVLNGDGLDAMKNMITRCRQEVRAHHILIDLSELVSSSKQQSTCEIKLDDVLWNKVESYTSSKLVSQECRAYQETAKVGAAEATPLRFTQQSDTSAQQTLGEDEDVVLKPEKSVWTAKGKRLITVYTILIITHTRQALEF